MTVSSQELSTVNAARRAHVQAIVTGIEDLKLLIASNPDLWYGGLPATLTNLSTNLDYNASVLRETFGIANTVNE